MKWLQYIVDKLPVKWLVIFTGMSIIGYFGLEFYKEHHAYSIRMAEIRIAKPSEAPEEEKNFLHTKTKVERIVPKGDLTYAKRGS